MFIQTEITPNPSTLKFLPGIKLIKTGSLEFKTKKEAESSMLAKNLFNEGYISNVFVGEDFITITKTESVDWDHIKPNILAIITEFFSSNKGFTFEKIDEVKVKEKYSKKEQDIIKQVEDILEERVKPAVAQDGGDIKFVKFKDGIVFLELRGACSGCPSSTITLKSGIENMLKYYIPEIVSVEAINN